MRSEAGVGVVQFMLYCRIDIFFFRFVLCFVQKLK